MRRKKVVRSAEYARETHVTLAGSRLARAAGMPRERGRRRSKRAGGAEWYEEKRRQERHPPRERKHISRAQCMTCSTVAVTTTEVTSHEATTCRRRCAPWLHAEPPTRKRSWHLAARSSPSSHPGDSHRRRPRQPARVPAPAPRGRSSPETARLRKNSNRHDDAWKNKLPYGLIVVELCERWPLGAWRLSTAAAAAAAPPRAQQERAAARHTAAVSAREAARERSPRWSGASG